MIEAVTPHGVMAEDIAGLVRLGLVLCAISAVVGIIACLSARIRGRS